MGITQNTETRDRVYALANLALAEHQVEHNLPTPGFISFPANGPIEVKVYGADAQTWLDTLHVDDLHDEYRPPSDGQLVPMLRSVWQCRLPSTGHRIEVRAWREVPFAHGPAALSVVPA